MSKMWFVANAYDGSLFGKLREYGKDGGWRVMKDKLLTQLNGFMQVEDLISNFSSFTCSHVWAGEQMGWLATNQ
ncbi:MAG: hypothetical protein NPIRA01_08520 [Nitrospirales bacterium]|nr:MAG: hypothetical protein NPIRA01_08520 [Nitrospirales bacterium]